MDSTFLHLDYCQQHRAQKKKQNAQHSCVNKG